MPTERTCGERKRNQQNHQIWRAQFQWRQRGEKNTVITNRISLTLSHIHAHITLSLHRMSDEYKVNKSKLSFKGESKTCVTTKHLEFAACVGKNGMHFQQKLINFFQPIDLYIARRRKEKQRTLPMKKTPTPTPMVGDMEIFGPYIYPPSRH